MKPTLHVLSIGSEQEGSLVRDALLIRPECHLIVATDYLELASIAQDASPDIAVLHFTLSASELRVCAESVRRRWPQARILVICARAEVLDDPLYDEWVRPGLSGMPLLAEIERLAAGDRAKCQTPGDGRGRTSL